MNDLSSSIDQWLIEQFAEPGIQEEKVWDPGFDAERRVVLSKLGPYQKLFLRPVNYKKRLFHTLYPLTIESWALTDQVKFYDGFCTIDVELDVRFQVTLNYVQANAELLPDVNTHIKAGYEGLVRDAVNKELLNLADGQWVETGLLPVERSIETAVNESLILKNIQCRTICVLKPSFEEFPDDEALDGRFAQESVYLSVVKKNFEFREKQQQEMYRQETEQEQERLEFQRKQLELQNDEEEINRQKQNQQAENEKLKLLEKEKQEAEKRAIETRLHEEKLLHDKQLKDMEIEADIRFQEQQLQKQQEIDLKIQEKKKNHQILVQEKQDDIEIQEFENQQEKWNKAKLRLQQEKFDQEKRLKKQELEVDLKAQEIKQMEQQKMDEQLQQARIKHQQKINELKRQAELEEQEKRFATSDKRDEFLQREIELLVLEKQRAELSQSVSDQ